MRLPLADADDELTWLEAIVLRREDLADGAADHHGAEVDAAPRTTCVSFMRPRMYGSSER